MILNVPLKNTTEQEIILNDFDANKSPRENLFKNNVRKLRHEFLDNGNKVFLITSTQKAAGKTTVIESLAASLVLSKKKVLLIDLNFSNNTLTKKHNPSALIQNISEKLNYN